MGESIKLKGFAVKTEGKVSPACCPAFVSPSELGEEEHNPTSDKLFELKAINFEAAM